MFYDINVQYHTNTNELSRTLSFLAELGYNAVALNVTITGKFPTDLTCRIPDPLPFTTPPSLKVLRRCTLQLSEPTSNARLNALANNYDLLALRPTDEKTFQNACNNLDSDLISMDLTQRLGFFFKFKTVSDAIKRGIPIEICYAQALLGDTEAKRNLISNAVGLVRATRGRGIVVASEARRALGCRGPWDVVNLAAIWGLPQDRAYEAVSKSVRSVIATATFRRTGYRGVIDVVHGGVKEVGDAREAEPGQGKKQKPQQGRKTGPGGDAQQGKKRKIAEVDAPAGSVEDKPISKREQKRRAKAARELQPTTTIGSTENPEKGKSQHDTTGQK